ncbi:hypothetical protein D7Y23_02915 [Corallococcus sp. AB050B]|nr:hypothetical protein D7Y23_02915 [Corallococcus sp. AB050B]
MVLNLKPRQLQGLQPRALPHEASPFAFSEHGTLLLRVSEARLLAHLARKCARVDQGDLVLPFIQRLELREARVGADQHMRHLAEGKAPRFAHADDTGHGESALHETKETDDGR